MKNLKKRMLKAGVTLGLVFGAALFAVHGGLHAVSAATIADIPSDAWSKSGTSLPEPPANVDGSPSYMPFATGDVNIDGGTLIDALPSSANNFGLGISFGSGSLMTGKVNMAQALDLSKKFTHESNLYFGGSGVTSGDGLTFMLAKDVKNSFGAGFVMAGSSLGVYGQVLTPPAGAGSGGSSVTPDKSAIPDSFVITMDTHKDQGYSAPSAMQSNMDDFVNYSGGSTQYVGYGYPGKSDMYKEDNKTSGQYYALKYDNTSDSGYANGGNYNLVNGTLNTGGWHQFKVSWVPDGSGGGKLTYALKVRDSSGNVSQTISRTITWTKANINDIFGAGTTSLTWGYVSSAYNGNEPHAVTFAQMGNVDVALSSSIVDENSGQPVTATSKGGKYLQLYEVNMADSSTAWPASGTLSLVLTTNKNYAFVQNTDGTVNVNIIGKSYKATVINDQQVRVDNIPAITYAGIQASTDKNIDAEVQAVGTDKSLTDPLTTIVMGGGSTIRTAQTALPVPTAQTVTNILIPSFTFGTYGITQFMTGFTDEGTATTSKDNQLAVTTDGNTNNVRMTVALNPVDDLAPGYTGGKVQLKFDFGGNNVDLTDDGTEKQLFSESTIPDTSVGKMPVLTVGKVPNVTTGAKNASLTWTVAVTPPVTVAAN